MLSHITTRIFIFASLLALGACAYTIDDSIQDLTIETPGAEDAVCNVYVEKVHYRFKPPQTVKIAKSKQDLVVDCYAPGNRHQKAIIKSTVAKSTFYNIANGVLPGASWDYASGAMFKYPDTVTVDFTKSAITPEDLPDQNNPDIKQPEEYMLEEFGASQPRLNSDVSGQGIELKRREHPSQGPAATFTDSVVGEDTGGPVSDKGDLKTIVIPATPSEPSTAAPLPLYPGQ